MAHFEFKDKEFYIDGRLKKEIAEKVIPQLTKKDKDVVFVVDGAERAGKSVFAMQLGGYAASLLGTEFDLNNVCMTPELFRKRIEECPKNSVVIYDEAHRGMASRRALSEINNILIDLIMEMGQKNLFVIVVLPTFFMMDKYPALYRASGLFHIYERKRQRGFWVYFNQKKKLKLFLKGKKEFNYDCMKWPGFRGRFFDQYTLDETEYRLKKEQSFKVRERTTKAEVYMIQRDIWMLILLEKYGKSSVEMAKAYKKYNKYGVPSFTESAIREMKRRYKEKEGKSSQSGDKRGI